MMLVTWQESFTGEDQMVKLDKCGGVQDAVNWINKDFTETSGEQLGFKVVHHEWNGLSTCVTIVEYNVATGNSNEVVKWHGTATFHQTCNRPDLPIGEWVATH